MHRDLKPENFLFANKKESAPLKAIDFGLSVFFKPGKSLGLFVHVCFSYILNRVGDCALRFSNCRPLFS